MYYLKVISLDGCPYSESANTLVKNNKIKSEIIQVDDTTKFNYKTNRISTFPQIYLCKKNSSGCVLLGGYTKLKYYFDKIHGAKNIDQLKSLKEEIKETNMELSEKSVLRLMELFF
tara:strand:- start:64 stop:411 length:348 start_codon:yes stop_codon:yes gene_type:complete